MDKGTAGWIKRRALGTKIALALGVVLTFLSIFNIFWLANRQEQQSLNEARTFANGVAETVLSSLNTMMVTPEPLKKGVYF